MTDCSFISWNSVAELHKFHRAPSVQDTIRVKNLDKTRSILLINGPNLNLIGTSREEKYYGKRRLDDIVEDLVLISRESGVELRTFQSNAEHLIIECVHKSKDELDFVLINPAALAHTSVSLRDALLGIGVPFIEIHMSNIYSREEFRRHSYLSDIAVGVICGLGADGYRFALHAAIAYINRVEGGGSHPPCSGKR